MTTRLFSTQYVKLFLLIGILLGTVTAGQAQENQPPKTPVRKRQSMKQSGTSGQTNGQTQPKKAKPASTTTQPSSTSGR